MIRESDLLKRVTGLLHDINPEAEIMDKDYHYAPDTFFNGLFYGESEKKTPLYGEPEIAESEIPVFDSVSIKEPELFRTGELVFLMEELIRQRYGRVVRAKGTVRINNELIRTDLSDDRYLITPAEETAKNGFVIIGEELDREALIMKLTLSHPGKLPFPSRSREALFRYPPLRSSRSQ